MCVPILYHPKCLVEWTTIQQAGEIELIETWGAFKRSFVFIKFLIDVLHTLQLVEAFHATLEEVVEADLLVVRMNWATSLFTLDLCFSGIICRMGYWKERFPIKTVLLPIS